jgi:hypothetical protein
MPYQVLLIFCKFVFCEKRFFIETQKKAVYLLCRIGQNILYIFDKKQDFFYMCQRRIDQQLLNTLIRDTPVLSDIHSCLDLDI